MRDRTLRLNAIFAVCPTPSPAVGLCVQNIICCWSSSFQSVLWRKIRSRCVAVCGSDVDRQGLSADLTVWKSLYVGRHENDTWQSVLHTIWPAKSPGGLKFRFTKERKSTTVEDTLKFFYFCVSSTSGPKSKAYVVSYIFINCALIFLKLADYCPMKCITKQYNINPLHPLLCVSYHV